MADYVTMKGFGHWGRFGNQFFQLLFLHTYAQAYGCELQLPPWVGTHLFGTSYPPVTVALPPWREPGGGRDNPVPPQGSNLVNHDFHGYAQYRTDRYSLDDCVWAYCTFSPVPAVHERLLPATERLLAHEGDVIGLHLRRGDYGQNIFPIVPVAWYLDWLHERRPMFKNPLLFIATEDGSLVAEFEAAGWWCTTVESLGVGLNAHPMADCVYLDRDLTTRDARALDWFPDWWLLRQCHVILGPSSTFSFAASMLAPRLREYWRSDMDLPGFRRTKPWSAWPLMRQDVGQYHHLKGVALDSNPYW